MSTSNNNNSKGILMSERPQSVFALNEIPASLHVPFLPSGRVQTHETHLGLPPAVEERENNFIAKTRLTERQRELKDQNVHVKHKKWLKDFQNDVTETKLNEIEDSLFKEEKKNKFMDTQAQLRKALRSVEAPGRLMTTDVNTPTTVTQTLNQVVKEQQQINQEREQQRLMERKKQEEEERRKLKSKPKWALSEKEAEEVLDQEADDLIDFANSLNFEDIIDDIEVREALNVIKSKVAKRVETESTKQAEDIPDNISEVDKGSAVAGVTQALDLNGESLNALRDNDTVSVRSNVSRKSGPKSVVHDKDWDSSVKSFAKENGTSINAVPTALKNIHSKASINTIAEQLQREQDQQKIETLMREIAELNEEAAKRNTYSPQIVTHDRNHISNPTTKTINGENDALNMHEQRRLLVQLKKNPNYVQNLPYLYRCPSI